MSLTFERRNCPMSRSAGIIQAVRLIRSSYTVGVTNDGRKYPLVE